MVYSGLPKMSRQIPTVDLIVTDLVNEKIHSMSMSACKNKIMCVNIEGIGRLHMHIIKTISNKKYVLL